MSPKKVIIALLLFALTAVWTPLLLGYEMPKTETQLAAAAEAEVAAIPQAAPLRLIIEPDDGIQEIEKAINEAKTSVDLVIYELEDPDIEEALAAAEGRGVSVRVILQNVSSFGRHPNQAAYEFLKEHKVPVQWAPDYFALTHQKTLIEDGVRVYIMTFNLTPQYYATSRDFGIVDEDPSDVAVIEETFSSDWSGNRITAKPGRDLVWSPNAMPYLLSLINGAANSLDIYNEEMAEPDVTDALEQAAKRGVDVRVVMTYATNWKEALNSLTAAGVSVRTYASSADFYIHAKAIIADRERAFVGSENFSRQSLTKNRELGILIAQSGIIDSLENTFESDYGNARPYAVLPVK